MSEEKLSYMAALDEWTDSTIIDVLMDGFMKGEDATIDAQEQVRKAIREKVLESYRNGQAAGPRRQVAPKGRVWKK
jgi:hypothetical protein